MGHVTVRVSQSSFGRETLQPQLRICRTKVFLEPRIEESGTDIPSHHGDDWISKHQYPNEIRDVLLSDCARTHEGADGTLPTSPLLLVLKVSDDGSQTVTEPPMWAALDSCKSLRLESRHGLLWTPA